MFNLFRKKEKTSRAYMVAHADLLAQVAYLTKHVHRLEYLALDQDMRVKKIEEHVGEGAT